MIHTKKIISVVGARPNFIKLAPISRALHNYKKYISHKIVHTGQHYDYKLSKIFFKDLELPEPDVYLGVGSSSHSVQTARIMIEFEKVLEREKPDLVIVYGDVNSTLACSLVCSKAINSNHDAIQVAHIEAGLRSFDKTMPEEINRMVTDHISKFLFVTEKAGVDNLINEGIRKDNIYLVGDVMIDTLVNYKEKFRTSRILKKLDLSHKEFIVVTLHRPVNVDDKNNLEKIVSLLEQISSFGKKQLKIVFPLHPRTKKMLSEFGLLKRLSQINNIKLEEPISYTDFIKLLSESRLVLTDSGGIQSEATFLKIPCLTLRETIEKPETIEKGTVTLCSLSIKLILGEINKILKGKYKKGSVLKLMDGKSAERIVKILAENLLD